MLIGGLARWRKIYSVTVVAGYFLAVVVAILYDASLDRAVRLPIAPMWGVLLGPFVWVFLNSPNSWVVPAMIGTIPWAIALQTQHRKTSLLFVALAPIVWLLLGIMGSGLQM